MSWKSISMMERKAWLLRVWSHWSEALHSPAGRCRVFDFLSLQRGQVLLQGIQQAAGGLQWLAEEHAQFQRVRGEHKSLRFPSERDDTASACQDIANSAQHKATLTFTDREREKKVQILTQTVNWRWRWREREKAGKNTENKGGNCQGEQENLRVSSLVLPLLLQLAALLTFAHLIEQWHLKISRRAGDGASLSAGHRSHRHLGRVPRFTPLFAVWRARSGVRVSWKLLVRATAYGATCIDWLMQRSQWERGGATWPNVGSSCHSGRRSTMWRQLVATAFFPFSFGWKYSTFSTNLVSSTFLILDL